VISQDQYWGTYCPSPVINVTPEATALINHTSVGPLIPPLRCNSARDGTPHLMSSLHSADWCSSDWLHIQIPPSHALQFTLAQLRLNCCFYIDIQTPYAWPYLTLLCSNTSIGAPASPTALLSPCWCPTASMWHSATFVGAPQPSFGALFHAVLLQHLLCDSLFHSTLPIWPSSCRWWLLPSFMWILIAIQTPIQIHSQLTCLDTLVRYYEFSQTIMEFNFIPLPGRNNQQIQEVPAVSLWCWWIMCPSFRQTSCDRRLSGCQWQHVWLISLNCLVGVLPQCTCGHEWIPCLLHWLLNVARQKTMLQKMMASMIQKW
jgi:hypothetical protein